MKKFKDADNKVHEIQEGFERLLPNNCVEIGDNEFKALTAPHIPTAQEIEAEKDALVDDMISQNRSVIKALVLCLNDGSIIPGNNVPTSELKAAIKAKL